ncbi:FIG002465: BNR repeat protein [hydrothermal vent metagenome]|uniref:FIG002465: BNR repeat protein n=1 Tax=hydrothermal vent metagenome TaxID=652676 RepID=A0A3B0ZJR6_9ZZZZ
MNLLRPCAALSVHAFIAAALLFSASFSTAAIAVGNGSAAAMPSKLAVHSLLLDGAQQAGLMVAVGERGHILYSIDKGHHWLQASVPTQTLLTGVHLYDSQLGWAVGHDATILRTQDGAKSWQLVYSDIDEQAPLLDVWFSNAQHGLAIGAYGLLLTTQDGGDSWQRNIISEEDDFHLNHIMPTNDGALIIAAEAGVIYRSDDNGQQWQPLPSPYHGSFFGSLPTSKQSLFLFGLRGHLFFSSNSGQQWQVIQTNTTAMLTAGLKGSDGRCYISGLSGTLLIAPRCNGSEIELKQLPGRSGISAMLQGDDAIILIGESGITRFTPQ